MEKVHSELKKLSALGRYKQDKTKPLNSIIIGKETLWNKCLINNTAYRVANS